MQYKVALKGIELATFTITVGDIVELDGKKVITVQSNAKLSGIAAWFGQKIDDAIKESMRGFLPTGRKQNPDPIPPAEVVDPSNVSKRLVAKKSPSAPCLRA